MLTVGSLFSGIGGIDLGLERAGMKVLWQVEIDEWCRAVLAKHWPDVERFEDVRSVGAGSLRPVDLIAGGFPCQDLSYAGRGAGITGARSGLWTEFARLIRELRPRYVLVENVPALLRRGVDRVLGDLAACGYDAEWDCIPAQAVGAPHTRDRIWLLAYPNGGGLVHGEAHLESAESRQSPLARLGKGGHALADAERPERWPSHSGAGKVERDGGVSAERQEAASGPRVSGTSLADTDRPRRANLQGRSQVAERAGDGAVGDSGWWDVEPAVGRVADGVPGRVDRLRGLGNAVVPQVVEWIGRRIVEAEEAA